ncbi:hypothetical protein CDL15_Pgr013460 [Punica granatum]|uniref:Uncharacterized protein n=1 Tax=Punica granatum TaxID=22663 RepID=A0A218W116_PUNGR|nr:hypothetical protein CDL15_Pgr013460 [Punica granatum]
MVNQWLVVFAAILLKAAWHLNVRIALALCTSRAASGVTPFIRNTLCLLYTSWRLVRFAAIRQVSATAAPPSLIAEWEPTSCRSGQACEQGDPPRVIAWKYKISHLIKEEEHLTWQVEQTKRELNKAKGRWARYVASQLQGGNK